MPEQYFACGCSTAQTRAHAECNRCETHCDCASKPDKEQELGEYNGMAD